MDENKEKGRETDLLVVVSVCAFEKHRKDASRRRSNMAVKGKNSRQYYLSNDDISSVYLFLLVAYLYILRLQRPKNLIIRTLRLTLKFNFASTLLQLASYDST